VDEARNQAFKGTFSLPAVQTTPKAYTIDLGDSQYFILENRQPLMTDRLMLGGVLVYHVDMAAPRRAGARQNSDEFDVYNRSSWALQHPQVRLVQPDGLYDLEYWSKTPSRNQGKRYNGDAGDWFPFINTTTGKQVEVADNQWMLPNINTYANLGKPSYLRLFNFSSKGPSMTFSFEFAPPTTAPSSAPTAAPTAPSSAPTTAVPTAAPTAAPANKAILIASIIGGLAATIALIVCGIKKFKPESEPVAALSPYNKGKVESPEL
jgi:hypothetical protein